MKKLLLAAVATGLLGMGVANAQTGGTTPGTPNGSSTVVTPMPAPGVGTAPSASTTPGAVPVPAPSRPAMGMNNSSMSNPATPSTSAAPAAVSSSANPRTTAAPVPGANSFTQNEAKARIGRQGYTNVSALKKDRQGIWRGTAMKDGKSGPVALDYQGNVVSQ